MRYALLDYVQLILSSMDSDEVNSITDTTESPQVANIVKTSYYDMVSRGEFPRHNKLFSLTASTDPPRPVTMFLPENYEFISWIKYGHAAVDQPQINMTDVKALPLEDFLAMVMSLNSTEPDVIEYTENINGYDIKLLAKNSSGPRYYTSMDGDRLFFDSYDAAVDGNLQSSKTMCYGQSTNTFVVENGFVPDLDDKQHQLLLNEAKSLAFSELKQTTHLKAEQTARRLWIDQQAAKTKIPLKTGLEKTMNFGRR